MRAKGALEASAEILRLLRNRQKPLATVTFYVPELHGAGLNTLWNAFMLVRFRLEVRTMHTGNLQNHWKT